MGYLCFRVVLSAKQVVSSLGHMTQPLWQGFVGFLNLVVCLGILCYMGNRGVFVSGYRQVVFGVWFVVCLQLVLI